MHRLSGFALKVLIFQALFFIKAEAQTNLAEYSRTTLKMGSRFEIIAVTSDSILARAAIEAAYQEIDRIENLISSWIEDSETSLINRNAGKAPVKVSKELFDLIFRSLKVSKLTGGAYDISFAGLQSIWTFDGQNITDWPDSNYVNATVEKVNFRDILLDQPQLTVFLRKPDMRIGFGSIGKGYAANSAMRLMKKLGVESGMVNAGGDLITWGVNDQGDVWTMGIANPENKQHILAWLQLQDMALVTSGDYERYFQYQGQRYGHIVDPRTGYPSVGIKSVSILCPDAELADALATSVYVMGEIEGMNLINQLKGIEGLIVTSDDRIVKSDNLVLNYYTSSD